MQVLGDTPALLLLDQEQAVEKLPADVLMSTHALEQLRALDGDGDLMADRAQHVQLVVRERAAARQQEVEDAHGAVLAQQRHCGVLLALGVVRQGLLQPRALDEVDRLVQRAVSEHLVAPAVPGHAAFAFSDERGGEVGVRGQSELAALRVVEEDPGGLDVEQFDDSPQRPVQRLTQRQGAIERF